MSPIPRTINIFLKPYTLDILKVATMVFFQFHQTLIQNVI